MLLIRLLLSISMVLTIMYAAHCSKCLDDQEDQGITHPIDWIDIRDVFNEFKLDGKVSCENQECSSWMHNQVLYDHGEPDDVDSDGDFRFDMIYRHHDVEDGVSINLGIEKMGETK